MQGLGDNFYQRAVVRELIRQRGPISLVTPWPQLYADLDVQCVRPVSKLRTQRKNFQRDDLNFTPAPNCYAQPIGYSPYGGSMLQSMLTSAGINADRVDFTGPAVRPLKKRPYMVVRPGTVRHEWLAAARNPRPEYLCAAVEALRSEYDIVSVADLQQGEEYAIEPLPYGDETFHRGELQLESLLALVDGAAGVIGGVGWLFPAAVAYQTPMLLVYGGWGTPNGAHRIMDARMDTSRIVQAVPDSFCMCDDRFHDCDKRISTLDQHIEEFREMVKNETVPAARRA